MTKEIKFKTVLSSLRKGGKACYRAIPITQGAVNITTLSEHAAERVGMDPSVMKFNAELLLAQVAEEMSAGRRVEIENFLSGGLAVEGVFEAANSPWDKSKHRLIPYFAAKGNMKAAFSNAVGVNVTDGNHCLIKRVLDTVAKTEGIISNAKDIVVYVSGINMLIDTAREDEGVWLEDAEGTIVATATVTASTSTTIDCTFAALPLESEGAYKLVVASRGGLGPEFGVSISRKAVQVKNTTTVG